MCVFVCMYVCVCVRVCVCVYVYNTVLASFPVFFAKHKKMGLCFYTVKKILCSGAWEYLLIGTHEIKCNSQFIQALPLLWVLKHRSPFVYFLFL